MEEALKSSGISGATIGVVLASRGVPAAVAFAILNKARNDSNRKLRELAADLLASTSPTHSGPLPSA